MARFHSGKGEFVGGPKLLTSGLKALYQAMERRLFGVIPVQPWIPFAATAALARELTGQEVAWEIGAGYSTIWISSRVRSLVSIEADEQWYSRLSLELKHRRITNVDLRYLWRGDHMRDFSAVCDHSLGLLFIDGGPRTECLINGFGKVRSGGLIYLDNWDTPDFWNGADAFLQENASKICWIRTFVDYVPAQFGVYEGCLIKLK